MNNFILTRGGMVVPMIFDAQPRCYAIGIEEFSSSRAQEYLTRSRRLCHSRDTKMINRLREIRFSQPEEAVYIYGIDKHWQVPRNRQDQIGRGREYYSGVTRSCKGLRMLARESSNMSCLLFDPNSKNSRGQRSQSQLRGLACFLTGLAS